MSKGKFSNPRPYREEEREIEKSFRQLTGQEKPPKPEDPIFSQASVPDLDAADPEAALKILRTPAISRSPGGTGLGLLLAKRILQAHGAPLTFSTDGTRLCARFTIPTGN